MFICVVCVSLRVLGLFITLCMVDVLMCICVSLYTCLMYVYAYLYVYSVSVFVIQICVSINIWVSKHARLFLCLKQSDTGKMTVVTV